MFEFVTRYVIEPEDIADGLNGDWGLTDPKDSRWVEPCDILDAISDYQCYGSNCYIDICFDEEAINWAKKDVEYHNDNDIENTHVHLRLRVLNWLRYHIPQPHGKCLLKIDY